MRITSKGQVTIPQEIREKAGLLPGTEVEFELDGRSVRIRKVEGAAHAGSRGPDRRPARRQRDDQDDDRRDHGAHAR